MTVHEREVEKPVARQYVVLGNIAPDLQLGVTNGDVSTCAAALLERMYYCKVGNEFLPAPLPENEVVQSYMRPFTQKFTQKLFKSTPGTHEEFVAQYSGPMRARYERALVEFNNSGVSRRHSYSNTFVKYEKINTSKAPRCIQPRDPVYNLCFGRYIKHIEKRMYKSIAKVFGRGPVVMKGYNVHQTGSIINSKFNAINDCVAIGLDATKFDMHVSPAMLNYEHDFYRFIYDNDKELNTYLDWQMNNVGRAYMPDGKIKYKVKGKRFSGDMNTALGNCILMSGMVYSYCKFKELEVFDLVNNGDDCVVFIQKQHLNHFMTGLDKWFLDLGFRMTVEEPVFSVEKIEFCQMHPIYDGSEWSMCRNWKTAIAKDAMCIRNIEGNDLKRWVYAVGEGGLKTFGGMPILSALYKTFTDQGISESDYQSMRRKGRNFYRRGNIANDNYFQKHSHHWFSQGMDRSDYQITDACRVSFYECFGITADEQVALEERISQVKYDFFCSDQHLNNPQYINLDNL